MGSTAALSRSPPTPPGWAPSPAHASGTGSCRLPVDLCCEPQHQLVKAQPNPHLQWRLHLQATVPVLQGPTTHHGFTPNHSSWDVLVPICDVHSSTALCFQAAGLLFKETFDNYFKKCKLRPSAPRFWMLPYLLEPLLQSGIEYFYYGTHIWLLNVLSISPDQAWIFILLLHFDYCNIFFIIAVNYYLALLVIRFITAWKILC